MRENSKLPDFTTEGLLPPGDYELTLEELAASLLVVGPESREHCPNWDAAWRGRLVENLAVMVGQLWQVGISAIFVDGSFADTRRSNCRCGTFIALSCTRTMDNFAAYRTSMATSLSSHRLFAGRDETAGLAASLRLEVSHDSQ